MSQEIKTNTKTMPAGQRVGSVHCLGIPLQQVSLLLPNAAIAEIIGYSEADPIEGAPPWLLGRLSWRDRAVPLISYESVMGVENVRYGSRIAILNTLNRNSRVPYIGIIMQDIPSLLRIKEESIETHVADKNHQSVSAYVTVDGKSYVIPDIDELEKRVENVSQH
jgi:chemosensory pili system protein ChpC